MKCLRRMVKGYGAYDDSPFREPRADIIIKLAALDGVCLLVNKRTAVRLFETERWLFSPA